MALQEMLQNLGGFQSLAANAQQMQQREELSANNRKASELLRSFYQGQQAGKPDYNKLNEAIMLSPEMSQNVLNGIGIQDKQQKQQAATDVVNLYQALGNPQAFGQVMAQRINGILERGGDPSDSIALTKIYNEQGADAARRAIQQVGAAFVNQGFIKPELVGFGVAADSDKPTSQKEFEYYQKLQRENPEAAKKFALARGYTETGKEQAQTQQERNLAKYEQMVAQGNPNAENFGVSAGILSREGRVLDATTSKNLVDAQDQAELNSVNVTKYIDLAEQYKKSGISGGLMGEGGSWREAMKAVVGSQDEVSKITSEWQKIKSGEAIASLPTGPATDADIKLARAPLPENANADYMEKYLRGLAKIAAYKEAYNRAKSDFLSSNGSLRDKQGRNFGSVWKEQRQSVLDSISADPRFSAQAEKDNVPPENKTQPPASEDEALIYSQYGLK